MDVTVTVVKIDKIEVFSSYPFIKNDLFTNMTTVYDTESHVSSRESVEVLPRKKKMLCNNHGSCHFRNVAHIPYHFYWFVLLNYVSLFFEQAVHLTIFINLQLLDVL